MSGLNFQYEFNFINGLFEQTIYDKCPIPENTFLTTTRQSVIEKTVDDILQIFLNIPGLNIFSTFVTVDNIIYKVTVKNI